MDRPSLRGAAIAMAVSTGIVVLAVEWGRSQTTAPQTKTDPRINEPFKRPDLKAFVKKFESDEREIYTKRREIVAALGLAPGMVVADVGTGTGFFTHLFAEKVGQSGKVYAVDIAPRFLAHIAAEARKRGHTQIATVQGSQFSTNLPHEAVDLVFLCDVYHHLENPENSLASIRDALKPGGQLVIIDFDRVEGRSSGFILKHVRASRDVFRNEIEGAGFVFVPSTKVPAFSENFFFRFKKPAPALRRSPDSREENKDRRGQTRG